jgi:hypothetical protein
MDCQSEKSTNLDVALHASVLLNNMCSRMKWFISPIRASSSAILAFAASPPDNFTDLFGKLWTKSSMGELDLSRLIRGISNCNCYKPLTLEKYGI